MRYQEFMSPAVATHNVAPGSQLGLANVLAQCNAIRTAGIRGVPWPARVPTVLIGVIGCGDCAHWHRRIPFLLFHVLVTKVGSVVGPAQGAAAVSGNQQIGQRTVDDLTAAAHSSRIRAEVNRAGAGATFGVALNGQERIT
jgi:hypothetical protein